MLCFLRNWNLFYVWNEKYELYYLNSHTFLSAEYFLTSLHHPSYSYRYFSECAI